MKNKVSIIIPIYKVEKYIRKCIDSVLNQTYKNIEIILIDDGSPDNCPKICDEYEDRDDRIKVIHKTNGGLSDARNVGISNSTGEWIAFIDSDDYVDEDYVETLLSICENDCDVGIILPMMFYETNMCLEKKNKSSKIIKMNTHDAVETLLYQKKFDTSAWGKIYKSELWAGVDFPVGKLYEDISTIYKILLKSNKVAFSNQKKYMYLQRNDSIMGGNFKLKDMDYVYQAEVMLEDIKKIENKNLTNAAICRYVNSNFSVLLKLNKNKAFENQIKELHNNIKKYRKKVLFDKKARFKTKIAILLNYIGII